MISVGIDVSKGKSTADADDLDAITVADPELSAFALSNAILSGRTVDAFIALDDFMGHAGDGAPQLLGIHNKRFFTIV